VAALRHRKFFSLEELNAAIRELLTKLNHRPFREHDGSRATAFEASRPDLLRVEHDRRCLADCPDVPDHRLSPTGGMNIPFY
jgi:hypothetical protein